MAVVVAAAAAAGRRGALAIPQKVATTVVNNGANTFGTNTETIYCIVLNRAHLFSV